MLDLKALPFVFLRHHTTRPPQTSLNFRAQFMVCKLILHRISDQPHQTGCRGCAMPRSQQLKLIEDSVTIELKQGTALRAKRKLESPGPQDQGVDAATREAIEKYDHLDDDYVPQNEEGLAAKKPKTSRKQEEPSKLYCLGIYSPPEKSKKQSRKDWALVHCRKTIRQLPDPRKVSAAALRAAYESSKALNVVMQGELEYQADVASDLRKKGTRDLQKYQLRIDELQVAVGGVEPTKIPGSKWTDKARLSSFPKDPQADIVIKGRFESISTNLANEVGSLKYQLATEAYDKVAAERELEALKAHVKLHQEAAKQPSAALRNELGEHKEAREQAEKQLKEALSYRSKAESEITRLKEEIEDRLTTAALCHNKKYQLLEATFEGLKEKLSKQDGGLRSMEEKVKVQQAAITRAKACLMDL